MEQGTDELLGWDGDSLVFCKETVNLTRLAKAFPSQAQADSTYRRLQRFLSDNFYINYDVIACFVVNLFAFLQSDGFYLTMDRTNWQWGKKHINILMLAIVYKGIAVPVYWILLNKKGNSNTRERIVIVKRFIGRFGKDKIKGLLADREFIGKDWFDWLNAQGIDFVIRIKKNHLVSNRRGEMLPAQDLFRMLKRGETLVLEGRRRLFDTQAYLSALRLEDDELLIVAAGKPCCDAIGKYAHRWEIETLFGCLKGRGFHFEDTHVTDRRRIRKMLIVLVIAFCWAHRVGEWHHAHVKAIVIKKHLRPAKSLFRLGMDVIGDEILAPLKLAVCNLDKLIKFIIPQQVSLC